MTNPVTPAVEDALITLVRRVGKAEIMPRFRNLDASDIAAKSAPDDLVTVADTAAETAISKEARNIVPGIIAVGEEAVAADPSLLAALSDNLCLVIDPIDGTWNFAKGLPLFGTILAVVDCGTTVWGMIYDPVMDDWIVARKGGGVWWGGQGAMRQITTPGTNTGTGFLPRVLACDPVGAPHRAALAASGAQPQSLRCSAHEYRTMLTGGADACVSIASYPWDHAAGALALSELGGAVVMRDGADYVPGAETDLMVAATDHARAADILARITAS